ncbi:MAG: SDR family oxidoreductase [Rhodocyclaceae bacterium]|jgi:NAD(P)-dependent dehydrogenase (short-subunit alcohol dehydrogenase family)|nr:SDR family oxidoreductase [Rhodocyclaceae bacterium]
MAGRLEGKVAVITGGTSGMGLASVELFVAEGARVVVGDIQDAAGAALQARFPKDVLYVRTDVTDDAAIGALVQTAVDRFGRLDTMFNNAGAPGDFSPMTDLSAEGFDRTMVLLARSVMSGHKYAANQFKKQGSGGSIISTSSAAGLQGGWSAAAYTVAKHAVIGIVRQATAELGPFGIRSNAICPGIIMTPIMPNAFGVPKERAEEFLEFLAQRFGSVQPIGRVGQPRDIAEAAVFLASDSSTFITGVALPVDGGSTAVTQGSFGVDAMAATKEFLGG